MLKTLAKLSRFLPFFGLNNAVFPGLRCRHCFPDMTTPYYIYYTSFQCTPESVDFLIPSFVILRW